MLHLLVLVCCLQWENMLTPQYLTFQLCARSCLISFCNITMQYFVLNWNVVFGLQEFSFKSWFHFEVKVNFNGSLLKRRQCQNCIISFTLNNLWILICCQNEEKLHRPRQVYFLFSINPLLFDRLYLLFCAKLVQRLTHCVI